jgi:hypothetical protein
MSPPIPEVQQLLQQIPFGLACDARVVAIGASAALCAMTTGAGPEAVGEITAVITAVITAAISAVICAVTTPCGCAKRATQTQRDQTDPPPPAQAQPPRSHQSHVHGPDGIVAACLTRTASAA